MIDARLDKGEIDIILAGLHGLNEQVNASPSSIWLVLGSTRKAIEDVEKRFKVFKATEMDK